MLSLKIYLLINVSMIGGMILYFSLKKASKQYMPCFKASDNLDRQHRKLLMTSKLLHMTN